MNPNRPRAVRKVRDERRALRSSLPDYWYSYYHTAREEEMEELRQLYSSLDKPTREPITLRFGGVKRKVETARVRSEYL